MDEPIITAQKDVKIAIPPINAVGFVCHRSFLGATIHPRILASFMTAGTSTNDNTNEINEKSKIS